MSKQGQVNDVFYINVSIFFESENDNYTILDNRFFSSKKEAMDYAKQYLIREGENFEPHEFLDHMMINYNYGKIDVCTDTILYAVEVCSLEKKSLNNIIARWNSDGDDLYYITFFSTLYYLEDDEIIEPDEIRYKPMLDHKLFCCNEDANEYIVECLRNAGDNADAKLHLSYDEEQYRLYGLYDEETAFEQHYTINSISKKSMKEMIQLQLTVNKLNDTSITKSKRIQDEVKQLMKDYYNPLIYDLLNDCINEFGLWY